MWQDFKLTLGCAGVIGLVFFAIGLVVALASRSSHPLLAGAMAGGMAFVAALLLSVSDRSRQVRAHVRRRLLARGDMEDANFSAHVPDVDAALLAETRQAVARFFEVPASKIHPADRLQDELQFDVLEPGVLFFVVEHVLKARDAAPRPYQITTADLAGIGDLARAIQRILDRPGDEAEKNRP